MIYHRLRDLASSHKPGHAFSLKVGFENVQCHQSSSDICRHPNGIAVEELVKEYRTDLGGDLDEAVANYAGGVREMVRLGGHSVVS